MGVMGAGEGLDVLGDRVGMPVWGAAEGDFVGPGGGVKVPVATHEISNEGVSLVRSIVFEVSPVWKLQSTSGLLLNKLNDTVPNIGGNDCSPEFSVKISVPATSFSFNAVKVNVVPVFCNPETCVESVTTWVEHTQPWTGEVFCNPLIVTVTPGLHVGKLLSGPGL